MYEGKPCGEGELKYWANYREREYGIYPEIGRYKGVFFDKEYSGIIYFER